MKVLASGFNSFNEVGKYTCATVEYTGLRSYSLLKRGGTLASSGLRKVTEPVEAAICWPYTFLKKRTVSLFKRKKYHKKIAIITEKIAQIEESLIKTQHEEKLERMTQRLLLLEERLAKIEKYGIVAASQEQTMKRRKALREDKRMLLKGILEETKALKNLE